MLHSAMDKTQSQKNRLNAVREPITRLRTEPIQRREVLGPLSALADETRLHILELLVVSEELSVEEFSSHLDLPRSIMVLQLRQLRKTRLIDEEQREGTNKIYRLNRARIAEITQALSQLLSVKNAQMVLNDVRRKLPPALHPYLDRNGVITNWPTEKKEQIVLDYLIAKFSPSEQYTEEQVNTLLAAWHTCNDTAYLRRRLVDFALLARTANGRRYWRITGK